MTLIHSGRGCPVCGAVGALCGHQPAPLVGGIVVPEESIVTGPATKTYDVVQNGYKTRMKLNDADAERLGVKRPRAHADADHEEKAAPAPANKSRTVTDK